MLYGKNQNNFFFEQDPDKHKYNVPDKAFLSTSTTLNANISNDFRYGSPNDDEIRMSDYGVSNLSNFKDDPLIYNGGIYPKGKILNDSGGMGGFVTLRGRNRFSEGGFELNLTDRYRPYFNPAIYKTNPTSKPVFKTPSTMRSLNRFLGSIISGIGSIFSPPPAQPNVTKLNIRVNNETEFINSIKIQNDTISELILSAGKKTVTDISQIQDYSLLNLVATNDFNFSLDSTQQISIFDSTTITVDVIKNIMSQLTTDILNKVEEEFKNKDVSELKSAMTTNNTTGLLSQILGSAGNSGGTVGQIITNDTNLSTHVRNVKETIIASMTKDTTCMDILTEFQTNFNQSLKLYVNGVDASNINISILANQSTKIVQNTVYQLKLQSKIVSETNTSDLYYLDQSVSSAIDKTLAIQTSSSNTDETISDAVNSVGSAAGSFFGSAFKPLYILGAAALGIGGVVFLSSKKNSPVESTNNATVQSAQPTDTNTGYGIVDGIESVIESANLSVGGSVMMDEGIDGNGMFI